MRGHGARFVVACAVGLMLAAPAHALKVATWNLLTYDTATGGIPPRQASFRTVMAGLDPDVLIVQELITQAARDSFLDNVLNVVQPGQWQASTFILSTQSAVYWKPAKVAVLNVGSFADGGPRDVLQCLVKPVGYLTNPGWFRLYSIHLKAGGPATPDSATRRIECTNIRNTLNNVAIGSVGHNFLLGGDSNFYGAYEGGYLRLTESQADNDGRSKDPLVMPGSWHVVSGYAPYHTQSTCATCPSYPGVTFSGGGMDDRFDLLFSSYSVQDGQGLDLIGYLAYGNDGLHFNTDINADGFNFAVGYTIATALHDVSDHLPVLMTLQLPSKVSAASQLDFGSVIAGAPAQQQNLAVSNIGTVPADALDYSLSAPAGFTAPAGSFSAAAGGAANNHTIGMSAATAGAKSGTLAIASDDPDTSSKSVKLSGRVLRHAVASLDSQAVVTESALDWGERAPGTFPALPVRLHDQGYDALQAQLSMNGAVITGGDGRFSIAGGFSPVLIGGTGRTWNVAFNDSGASQDTAYDATLTFTSADEPLPGATAASDLVVQLHAYVISAATGVPGPGVPAALRFYPPRPNPAAGPVRFAFDLTRRAPVTLELFDLSGRRVASVISGELDAGHHEVRWDAGAGAGQPGAGLYFARFATAGLTRTARVVLLP